MLSAPDGAPRCADGNGHLLLLAAMRSFVLALTGRDRPGIVAAVTGVLLEHGLNLEDAEMAILRGHFAVMLVLRRRTGSTRRRSARDLDGVRRRSRSRPWR